MANQEELTRFIADRAAKFDIRVLQMLWPERIGSMIHDFHLEAIFEGRSVEGRGSDTNADVAIAKAFVEAAERFVMHSEKWPTSNGVAGHTDQGAASQNAINELYERHVFFDFFVEEKKFPVFDSALVDEDVALLLSNLRGHGISVKVANVNINRDKQFALTAFSGENCDEPYGIILGTAVANDISSAIKKALIEAMRYHFFAVDRKLKSLSLDAFNKKRSPLIGDHGLLGLDFDYATWFTNTYLPDSAVAKTVVLPVPDLEFRRIDLFPLFFVRATHSSLRNFDLGIRSKSNMPHPFR